MGVTQRPLHRQSKIGSGGVGALNWMLYGLAHVDHVPLSEFPLRDMSRWFDGHPLSPKVQTRQRPIPRALVVSPEVRVSSEGVDLGFQIAG